MNGDRIEMSVRDRDVLKVMSSVLEGRRSQAEAARLLKRSVRQVRRLQRRLERDGDGAVVHVCRQQPRVASGDVRRMAGKLPGRQ